jgi:hypothetical protein
MLWGRVGGELIVRVGFVVHAGSWRAVEEEERIGAVMTAFTLLLRRG